MTSLMIISQYNFQSGRQAIVSDEGASVWLYLTERNSKEITADCWLLNTVAPPTNLDEYSVANSAPPVTKTYAGPGSQGTVPVETTVHFQWSADGDSVAVSVNGELLGFIASGNKRGFSKHLLAEGPFGQTLDKDLYAKLFK